MLNVLTRSAVGGFAAVLLGSALAVLTVTQATAAGGITHEAVLAAGSATVTVHGGAGAAGNRMSVLVLDEDADLAAPSEADIVYLNEVVLDGAGDVTLTFALPSPHLDEYAIAMNAGSGRYVASLDPAGTLPGSGTPGAGGSGGGAGGGSGGSSSSGSGSSAVRSDAANGTTPAPAASGTPARPTPAPTTTPAKPSTSNSDPAVAAPSSTESGPGVTPWIVGGGLLLIAVVGGGWLFRRGTSRPE